MRKLLLNITIIVVTITLLSISIWLIQSHNKYKTGIIIIKDKKLYVEIALTERERQKGYMFRKVIPDGTGMLFVYPRSRKITLWMKNTYVPLSVAFIDRYGKITEIVKMDEPNTPKLYESAKKVKYALEVPLGWFKKNGIKTGDYCKIQYTSK